MTSGDSRTFPAPGWSEVGQNKDTDDLSVHGSSMEQTAMERTICHLTQLLVFSGFGLCGHDAAEPSSSQIWAPRGPG